MPAIGTYLVLKLSVLRPQSPRCGDHGCVPPLLAAECFYTESNQGRGVRSVVEQFSEVYKALIRSLAPEVIKKKKRRKEEEQICSFSSPSIPV